MRVYCLGVSLLWGRATFALVAAAALDACILSRRKPALGRARFALVAAVAPDACVLFRRQPALGACDVRLSSCCGPGCVYIGIKSQTGISDTDLRGDLPGGGAMPGDMRDEHGPRF